MRLPPPIGPLWNLRLFRRTLLAFFLVLAFACAIALFFGKFKTAASIALPALLFWLQWRSARRVTESFERWATRRLPRVARI